MGSTINSRPLDSMNTEEFSSDDLVLQDVAIPPCQLPTPPNEQEKGSFESCNALGISAQDEAWIRKHNQQSLTTVRDCVHELFTQRARIEPDEEAISSWDACFTYADVDRLSTLLAYHLLSEGIHPGSSVPIIMDKSALVPIAILATLKAGGCYVPLNADSPKGRLRDILEDTGAKIVIQSSSKSESGPGLPRVLSLTHDYLAGLQSSTICDQVGLPEVLPTQPCACIFTSGSTGKPKGVVLSHQALSTDLASFAAAIDTSNLRLIQCSSLAFDVASLQVLTPLTCGGCVCIPHEDEYKVDLEAAINRMSANAMLIVPSHAAVMDPKRVTGLKVVLFAGEMLRSDVLQRWSESQAVLMNGYGPSEASPLSTVQTCDLSSPQGGRIGLPLSSHRAIVASLDDHNKLAPVGASGQLLLGGNCLADGYLANPDLTRKSFIDAPPWAHQLGLPETRFYCTGDVVRYDVSAMDGSLELIGRRDTQVKLHGQKVELEEVEQLLRGLPGVEMAMASVPHVGRFANQLVAIVATGPLKLRNEPIVPTTTTQFTFSKVKEQMRQRLPEFMIPTGLFVVKDFLYTATQKLDRRQMTTWLETNDFPLEAGIQQQEAELLCQSEATANSISRVLADVCSERGARFQSLLLSRDVSLDDVGLDSIQRIKITHSLRSRFGISIPGDLIFGSNVTVRSLAQYINNWDHSVLPVKQNVDLLQEAKNLLSLVPTEEPCVNRMADSPSEAQRLLLTGATGFLGIEVLHQLMKRSTAAVIAIVRGESDLDAGRRLVASATKAGWWQEEYKHRIEVWKGDLSKPEFGLESSRMVRLEGDCNPADRITAIVHNGAVVHYRKNYASLKDQNVMSTVQLLRIQQANSRYGERPGFLFVSGGQHLALGQHVSQRDVADVQENGTGYAKSKLVSELLVKFRASPEVKSTHPCPSTIIKPGYIIGTADGRMGPVLTDYIWRFVIACVSLQAVSLEHLDNWIPVADVSAVAEVIVTKACGLPHLDLNSVTQDNAVTWRVSSGLTLMSLVKILKLEFGFPIEAVPKSKWLSLVKEAVAKDGSSHPLFPLLDQFGADSEAFQPPNPNKVDQEASKENWISDVIRANIKALRSMGALQK